MKFIGHFVTTAIVFIALLNTTQAKSLVEFLNLNQAAKLKFITLGAKCLAEHNPSDALIEDLRNLKFTEDHAVKCYVHCLLSGFGVYNDNSHHFELNKVNEIMFPKDRAMAEQCAKEASGDDNCDVVYQFYKCTMVHFHS